MKKTIRILLPIVLAIAIILCTAWYLFEYDRPFTRDMLLTAARYSESQGNHKTATFFYNLAYSHAADNDAVAIELAEQYKASGNFTKAEYTLSNAIADGGGIDLYIALCKTYVQQDKLLDAVTMLDNIANTQIKAQLLEMRPEAPTATPEPGFYNQYISVALDGTDGTIYASPNGQYPSISKDKYNEPFRLNDGENTIYAVSVDDRGLVSPLSIFGYTVGGVIELVEFNDSAIESEIRTLLNINSEKEIYSNDLWTIKSFTVPAAAKDYSVLRYMAFVESLTIDKGNSAQLSHIATLSNLTELKISNTAVSQDDLKSISALPMLTKLTLANCSLSGIAPLENAKELVALDLNNNTIRNLQPLSGMTKLQELNLQHNAVSDLSPLSSVSGLVKLDVSYNSLATLAPISTLTGLTWLDANTNTITELGDLANLKSLSYLSVKSNKLTSVAAIAKCTSLTELNIASNQISDIADLAALTKMMYFDFSYNTVAKIPAFPKSCELVTINGSNNKITNLDNLSGLKNLNIIYMDYNSGISSIKSLAKCPKLIEVNVYATKVKDVSALTNQSIIVNYKPV